MKRNYWLDLFTGTTWAEFQKAGSSVSGFRESRWKTVQKIAQGDYFLCYLTGVSRFIGILEVTSAPFKKSERDIWQDDEFPCRFEVKPIVELTPETAIPVWEFRDRLTCFQNLKSGNGPLRSGSPLSGLSRVIKRIGISLPGSRALASVKTGFTPINTAKCSLPCAWNRASLCTFPWNSKLMATSERHIHCRLSGICIGWGIARHRAIPI